jgi:hypothetical protein
MFNLLQNNNNGNRINLDCKCVVSVNNNGERIDCTCSLSDNDNEHSSDSSQSELPHSELPQSDLPHSELPQSELPQSESPQSELPHSDLTQSLHSESLQSTIQDIYDDIPRVLTHSTTYYDDTYISDEHNTPRIQSHNLLFEKDNIPKLRSYNIDKTHKDKDLNVGRDFVGRDKLEIGVINININGNDGNLTLNDDDSPLGPKANKIKKIDLVKTEDDSPLATNTNIMKKIELLKHSGMQQVLESVGHSGHSNMYKYLEEIDEKINSILKSSMNLDREKIIK